MNPRTISQRLDARAAANEAVAVALAELANVIEANVVHEEADEDAAADVLRDMHRYRRQADDDHLEAHISAYQALTAPRRRWAHHG